MPTIREGKTWASINFTTVGREMFNILAACCVVTSLGDRTTVASSPSAIAVNNSISPSTVALGMPNAEPSGSVNLDGVDEVPPERQSQELDCRSPSA